jgi:hypothetical protein
VSVAFQPWAPYFVVKSLTSWWPMPVVSLPWQNLTVPLGGLSSDLGSMTFAPSTLTPPPPLVLVPPPPPPPPPPPLFVVAAATGGEDDAADEHRTEPELDLHRSSSSS